MHRPRPATLLLTLALGACGQAPDTALMSGYAEADLVYVAAASAGTLLTLPVQRGEIVRQGQPLFTLDSDAEVLSAAGADALECPRLLTC